ncbi:MAG: hypothetical protein CMJ83_03280 [Planctomycetes bacterium]|nr:hypothetical protein [Planctomycetota bacterium]
MIQIMRRRPCSAVTAMLLLALIPLLFPRGMRLSVCLQRHELQLSGVGEVGCPTASKIANEGREAAGESCCGLPVESTCCSGAGEPRNDDDPRDGGERSPSRCRCCIELATFGGEPTIAPRDGVPQAAPALLATPPSSAMRFTTASRSSSPDDFPGRSHAPPAASFAIPLLI